MTLRFRPLYFLIVPMVLLMSSCLKNEVDDLERKLNEIEKALGSNEPIVMNFSTTNENGVAVEKNAAFLFKSSDYNSSAMYDDGDGIYYVYVYRGLDVGFNEEVELYFSYDVATKEVSDEGAYVNWRDQFSNRINPTFDPDNAGHTVDVTVNSFNSETGQINVVFDMKTTADAGNNEYAKQPMTCKLQFKGKLGIFKD